MSNCNLQRALKSEASHLRLPLKLGNNNLNLEVCNLVLGHHGTVEGASGPCHELVLADGQSVLVDCDPFQGAEKAPQGVGPSRLEIELPFDKVRAHVVAHVHIDHVGRISNLFAADSAGSVLCCDTSAVLMLMALEDA